MIAAVVLKLAVFIIVVIVAVVFVDDITVVSSHIIAVAI